MPTSKLKPTISNNAINNRKAEVRPALAGLLAVIH